MDSVVRSGSTVKWGTLPTASGSKFTGSGSVAPSVAPSTFSMGSATSTALFELPLPGVAVSIRCMLGDTTGIVSGSGGTAAGGDNTRDGGAKQPSRVNAVHVFVRYRDLEVSPMVFVFAEQLLQELVKLSRMVGEDAPGARGGAAAAAAAAAAAEAAGTRGAPRDTTQRLVQESVEVGRLREALEEQRAAFDDLQLRAQRDKHDAREQQQRLRAKLEAELAEVEDAHAAVLERKEAAVRKAQDQARRAQEELDVVEAEQRAAVHEALSLRKQLETMRSEERDAAQRTTSGMMEVLEGQKADLEAQVAQLRGSTKTLSRERDELLRVVQEVDLGEALGVVDTDVAIGEERLLDEARHDVVRLAREVGVARILCAEGLGELDLGHRQRLAEHVLDHEGDVGGLLEDRLLTALLVGLERERPLELGQDRTQREVTREERDLAEDLDDLEHGVELPRHPHAARAVQPDAGRRLLHEGPAVEPVQALQPVLDALDP